MTSTVIYTVYSLDEIPFEDLTSDDVCVLFDLDDTLFTESLAIMRNVNFTERKKFVESIRMRAGNERVAFLHENMKYQLVEVSALDKLGLQSKVFAVMPYAIGFTARRTGKETAEHTLFAEDYTMTILDSLSLHFNTELFEEVEFIDMNTSNPEYKDLVADTRLTPFDLPSGVMVKQGVVFCNNLDKGFVLDTIFTHLANVSGQQRRFKKICLIDDLLKNHHTMSKAVERLGMSYIGYHYEGAKLLDNTLNPTVTETQRRFLLRMSPKVITDEQVKSIM